MGEGEILRGSATMAVQETYDFRGEWRMVRGGHDGRIGG
jgi:hypothetical protein